MRESGVLKNFRVKSDIVALIEFCILKYQSEKKNIMEEIIQCEDNVNGDAAVEVT